MYDAFFHLLKKCYFSRIEDNIFLLSNSIWIVNIDKEIMEDICIFASFIAYRIGNILKIIDATSIFLVRQHRGIMKLTRG